MQFWNPENTPFEGDTLRDQLYTAHLAGWQDPKKRLYYRSLIAQHNPRTFNCNCQRDWIKICPNLDMHEKS